MVGRLLAECHHAPSFTTFTILNDPEPINQGHSNQFNADPIHILVRITPDTTVSGLVRDIKANSSKFINQKQWVIGRFESQVGFGAFSYSRSQLDDLVKYIKNQEKHHIRKTFREEYLEILKRFNVNYDERYIFAPVEEDTGI